ncbi:hypothetical protein D3C84_925620 [compost metagenome]
MHGAGFQHFALNVDEITFGAGDDHAHLRIRYEFLKPGSDLLLDSGGIKPLNIDSPYQRKGNAAVGEYAYILLELVFPPNGNRKVVSLIQLVSPVIFDGIGNAGPNGQRAQHRYQ